MHELLAKANLGQICVIQRSLHVDLPQHDPVVVLFTIVRQVKTNTKFTMNLQKNFKNYCVDVQRVVSK
jgi:hypothetical protein